MEKLQKKFSVTQKIVLCRPPGVRIVELKPHCDRRGMLIEVYRDEWLEESEVHPIQWTAFTDKAGVLRGMKVHLKHMDYIVPVRGKLTMALCDLRQKNSRPHMLEFDATYPRAIVVPPGVAHGYYCHEDVLLMVGLSAYFNPEHDRYIAWNDPELNIPWPVKPLIADLGLGKRESLTAIRERVRAL